MMGELNYYDGKYRQTPTLRSATDGNSSQDIVVHQDYSSTMNNVNTMMIPAINNSALNENSMSLSAQ
jgi:hypothetical protein